MSFHVHATKVRAEQTVYTKTVAVEIEVSPEVFVRFSRSPLGNIHVTVGNDRTRAQEEITLTPEESDTFVTSMGSLVPNE
jgi:hypothetical protein